MYVQIGAFLTAYKLDTFFTQKLPAGGVPVDIMATGASFDRFPLEVVTPPDAYVYPENPAQGWTYSGVDGQERLYDFDCDDRGFVYAAYSVLGWGILQDDGRTGTKPLPLVWQVLKAKAPYKDDKTLSLVSPTVIMSLKVGSKYYALVSDQSATAKTDVWDVSANPPKNMARPVVTLNDGAFGKGIRQWAKNADGTNFAYVDGNNRIQIYNGSTFINGGGPLLTQEGRTFITVASDGINFWAVDSTGNFSGNKVWKFSPNGGGYNAESFSLGTMAPQVMGINGGYLAVAGTVPGINVGSSVDVALYKITGAAPEQVDLKNYFRNYYGSPPSAAYARPGEYASTPRAIQPWKQNNKLYLMYSMHGLGDVYEIQAGESIDGTSSLTGTQNSNNPTRATAPGPFPGDPITFTSSTTAAFAQNVNWTLDNPELGSGDVAVPKRTGESFTYQYAGLTTATITRPRTVMVKGATDPSMNSTLTITHKVPTARVGVASLPNAFITAGSAVPVLVSGDSFTDASEGTIEGHFGNYTITPDAVNVNKRPDETTPVGQCGDHVLTFTAHYGPYSNFTPANASHYTATIPNIAYSVRPYTVALGTSTLSGAGVVFSGTAHVGDVSAFSTAVTSWNVTWTLKNSAGADIVPPQSTSVPLGTIPTFAVANSALITAGSTLLLKADVPSGSLATACQNFSAATASLQFDVPSPVITKTGCANAGSPCSFSATAASGDTNGWTYAWILKNADTNAVVATGTTNPFDRVITTAGNYRIELTATKSILSSTATPISFTVAAALCGALPDNRSMGIRWNCPAEGCVPSAAIEFLPAPFGYVVQSCHTLSWSFGDNTATQMESGADLAQGGVFHSYAGGGTYTVTLVFGSTASSATSTFTKQITIGTPPPPPPTCNDPSPISFTYTGSKGCNPSKACTTAETITFQAVGSLQNCDTLRWSFDGVTTTESFPQKLYGTPGNRTVSLTVRNTNPTTGALRESTATTQTVQVIADTVGCTTQPRGISLLYSGSQSSCSNAGGNCKPGEVINFDANDSFAYHFQACDKFEWNFDDSTPVVTTKSAPHVFSGTKAIYHVTLRVYNEAGSVTLPQDINVGLPADPAPVLNFETAPATATVNANVTFKANSNLSTTSGWNWSFDGSTPETTANGSSSSITHKFTTPGPHVVVVKAKNGTSPEAQLSHTITISAVPQIKFLLPVVTHAKGAGSSVWRTDLQIFRNSGGAAVPLDFKVEFISNKQTYAPKTLSVTQSTYIHQDFVSFFTSADDSGSMVLTLDANVIPQIWTRIYNVSDGGTFGQYIPAILLNDGTSASSTGAITSRLSDGPTNFYLPGLRVPSTASSRFRTNVGFVNVTPAAITLTVKAYDDRGLLIGTFSRTVFPFQLDQFNIASQLPRSPEKAFSLRIESPTGSGLLAYASILDNVSNDPAYISAVPEDDVKHTDFRNIVLPGVGHLASGWRSDVTIFNPNSSTMSFNLTYYDSQGVSRGSASNVVLSGNSTLQLDDLLREGTLQPLPADGLGILRIDTVASEGFPTVVARTYFDKGADGSYGQGIGGFALNRANVKPGKPGYIPAVRSDDNYYTNVGMVNVSTQTTVVKVTLLQRDTGAEVSSQQFELPPNSTIIRSPSGGVDLLRALDPSADRGSFKIEIVSGGNVWAFASMINGSKTNDPNHSGSKDPEYVAAIPTP